MKYLLLCCFIFICFRLLESQYRQFRTVPDRGPMIRKSFNEVPAPPILPSLQEIDAKLDHHVIPISNTSNNPFFMEIHMTRYFGECFRHFDHHRYNSIAPWMRNFQLIVTHCGIDWRTSQFLGSGNSLLGTCIYRFDANDPMQHEFYQSFDLSYHPNEIERIHIHSDRKHHQFFLERILPILEKRAEITKKKYILHSGGGDASPALDFAELILKNRFISHWIVEQNVLDSIKDHPKLTQLPIGICGRENSGTLGKHLRMIANGEQLFNNSINPSTIQHEPENASAINEASLQYHHRLLQGIQSSKQKPFLYRQNKILFCFSSDYLKRKLILNYLDNHPELIPFVDICNSTLTHSQLWELYTSYKFVFSPWGNGPDCGRTWEILLLGSIPLIQYFTGALGYLQGNLTVILIHQESDLNPKNITTWLNDYQKATPHERLTRSYWNNNLFHYKPLH
jgi:hypothetical protein